MSTMTMGHTECPNCSERVLIKNDTHKSACPNCGVIRESRERKIVRYQNDVHKDQVVMTDPSNAEDKQLSWINGPQWPRDFESPEVTLDEERAEPVEEDEDGEST